MRYSVFKKQLMLTPITLLTAPSFPTRFFLEVISSHPYLNRTTTTNHQGFTHLSLWVNYLFGSLSSPRNNCTKIKRHLQNCLVCRNIHRDFFKIQSFQKKINIKFSPLSNLFSAFSLCNAIMSFLGTGHTS